jgi:5-methylcytosine-specific restriction endonuclease McrA
MADYPFKLSHIEFKIDECVLVIVNLDKTERLGLSERFVTFIREHGRCSFCDSTFADTLNKCSCSKPKSRKEHLHVRFPQSVYYSVLYPILQKENGRKKMAIRSERIKENGGSHTKNDLAALIAIQENSCYFCGTEIELISGLNKAHADHYESIFDGGRNDVQNIVMTCPSCNLKKGTLDGSHFENLIRKTRTPEISKKLGVIRRSLNSYKKKLM